MAHVVVSINCSKSMKRDQCLAGRRITPLCEHIDQTVVNVRLDQAPGYELTSGLILRQPRVISFRVRLNMFSSAFNWHPLCRHLWKPKIYPQNFLKWNSWENMPVSTAVQICLLILFRGDLDLVCKLFKDMKFQISSHHIRNSLLYSASFPSIRWSYLWFNTMKMYNLVHTFVFA